MRKFLLYFIFSIIFSPFVSAQSSPTDYFRSIASGDWSDITIWESSPDNLNWVAATLAPTYLADTILIRNANDVSLTSSVTADQVIIDFNAVLINNMAASNVFTINDGLGDDMLITNGGIYRIISGNGYAGYQTVNSGATVHIKTGGVISIGSGGPLGGGNHNTFVITPITFVWDNASIFDWNTFPSIVLPV